MATKRRNDWKGKAAQLEREKAETERENQRLQRRIEAQKVEDKKRFSVVIFCEACLEVSSVLYPPGVDVELNGDCVVCRVRGRVKLVRKVNGNY